MKDSPQPYAVVDLFAGPGGLGEGFAASRAPEGGARFTTVLSIEDDRHAHQTLLLRTFLRKFEAGFPDEYYRSINEQLPEPDWPELAPDEWRQASDETRCLTLGSAEARDFLDERIAKIHNAWGDRTILIGGPPCQAYSVVGRSRNAAVPNYDPRTDHRYRLYQQYIDVLAKLRPAVAVMENVKGLLSATLDGSRVFPVVLAGLRYPRNDTTYRTYALCPRSRNGTLLDHAGDLDDFVVRAEEHGVPQARHRVFVVCVRQDIADDLPAAVLPRLQPFEGRVSVATVIGAMPRLRSQLSRGDSPEAWRQVIFDACGDVTDLAASMAPEQGRAYRSAASRVLEALKTESLPTRGRAGHTRIPESCLEDLRNWLLDDEISS